jgi:hypothetical protein
LTARGIGFGLVVDKNGDEIKVAGDYGGKKRGRREHKSDLSQFAATPMLAAPSKFPGVEMGHGVKYDG